jgi:hypothetical protein
MASEHIFLTLHQHRHVGSHAEYLVESLVRWSTDGTGVRRAAVWRRYSEFRRLWQALRRRFRHASKSENLFARVTFPRKKIFRNLSPDFLARRKASLALFLQLLLRNSELGDLRTIQFFLDFLGQQRGDPRLVYDDNRHYQRCDRLFTLRLLGLDHENDVSLKFCRLIRVCEPLTPGKAEATVVEDTSSTRPRGLVAVAAAANNVAAVTCNKRDVLRRAFRHDRPTHTYRLFHVARDGEQRPISARSLEFDLCIEVIGAQLGDSLASAAKYNASATRIRAEARIFPAACVRAETAPTLWRSVLVWRETLSLPASRLPVSKEEAFCFFSMDGAGFDGAVEHVVSDIRLVLSSSSEAAAQTARIALHNLPMCSRAQSRALWPVEMALFPVKWPCPGRGVGAVGQLAARLWIQPRHTSGFLQNSSTPSKSDQGNFRDRQPGPMKLSGTESFLEALETEECSTSALATRFRPGNDHKMAAREIAHDAVAAVRFVKVVEWQLQRLATAEVMDFAVRVSSVPTCHLVPLIGIEFPAAASSELAGHDAQRAVDSTPSTCWRPLRGTEVIDPEGFEWLAVQLGGWCRMFCARVRWSDGSKIPNEYAFEVSSDGTQWTRVATESGFGGVAVTGCDWIETILPERALGRHVRLIVPVSEIRSMHGCDDPGVADFQVRGRRFKVEPRVPTLHVHRSMQSSPRRLARVAALGSSPAGSGTDGFDGRIERVIGREKYSGSVRAGKLRGKAPTWMQEWDVARP